MCIILNYPRAHNFPLYTATYLFTTKNLFCQLEVTNKTTNWAVFPVSDVMDTTPEKMSFSHQMKGIH